MRVCVQGESAGKVWASAREQRSRGPGVWFEDVPEGPAIVGGRCSFHKPMRHLHAGGGAGRGEEAQGCWRASVRGLVQGQVSLAWHGGVGRGAPGGVTGAGVVGGRPCRECWWARLGEWGLERVFHMHGRTGGMMGVCSSGLGLGLPETVWERSLRTSVVLNTLF